MKTTELIKWLSDNNWNVEESEDYIKIVGVMNIHKRMVFILIEAEGLSLVASANMLEKVAEYMKTPIANREGPQRYTITPKGMKMHVDVTLEYNHDDKVWGDSETMGNNYLETQYAFTVEELEELGIDIDHFDLEELDD